MNALTAQLARRIESTGPLSLADYMAAALTDPIYGYYRLNDPLGRSGDFITAPEISQLFGELLGAWMIDCWDRMGRPKCVHVVELGPGRGTLMADALRVGRRVAGWPDAIRLHLVEINPPLKELQAERLSEFAPHWHDGLASLPEGPTLLIANEFLDAMPIRQLVFRNGAWRERLIGWNTDIGFYYLPSHAPSPLSHLVPASLSPVREGDIFELSTVSIGIASEVARHVFKNGGAALFIDYGRTQSALGESLQAVRRHEMVGVLDDPGKADLSAHVDFGMIRRASQEAGAKTYGPVGQGQFLRELGIEMRAERLKAQVPQDQAALMDVAVHRLIDPSEMGLLFKVLGLAGADLSPAGFSAGSSIDLV